MKIYVYVNYYGVYCLVSLLTNAKAIRGGKYLTQCLATVTPLQSKNWTFGRDVISLLARVFIFLIDRATQEVPMKNIGFEIYAIELLSSMSTDKAWRHLRTLLFHMMGI